MKLDTDGPKSALFLAAKTITKALAPHNAAYHQPVTGLWGPEMRSISYVRSGFVAALLACSFLSLTALTSAADAVTIGTLGSSNTCYPFSCFAGLSGPGNGNNQGTVYQEVFKASAFAGILTTDTIKFFTTQSGPIDSATYDISFYYAKNSYFSQSTTLADNLGGLLADWGSFSLTTLPTTLTFTGTPFTYDPGNGDLLMQVTVLNVTNSDGATATQPGYLARDASTSSVSEYSANFTSTSSNGPLAGIAGGPVAQFIPVPEPASLSLLALGLLGLGTIRRRS